MTLPGGWQDADWMVFTQETFCNAWGKHMALYNSLLHTCSKPGDPLSSDKYKTSSQVPVDGCKWCRHPIIVFYEGHASGIILFFLAISSFNLISRLSSATRSTDMRLNFAKDLICKNCNSFSDCVRQPRVQTRWNSKE